MRWPAWDGHPLSGKLSQRHHRQVFPLDPDPTCRSMPDAVDAYCRSAAGAAKTKNRDDPLREVALGHGGAAGEKGTDDLISKPARIFYFTDMQPVRRSS